MFRSSKDKASSTFYAQSPTTVTDSNNRARHTKLVMLGESSVGKTSLVSRFVSHQFWDHQPATISSAYSTRSVHTEEGVQVTFEIWDTAGSERFHAIAPQYYRKAQAAIVVYDIQSEESFQRATRWVDELREKVPDKVAIALVGNKVDMVEERAVGFGEAKAYANAGGMLFLEASAKTGYMVEELFQEIAKIVAVQEESAKESQTIQLEDVRNERKLCCVN